MAYSRESTARHIATGKASTHFSDSHCTHVPLGLGVACLFARAMSEVFSSNMKNISLIVREHCCNFRVRYMKEWWTVIHTVYSHIIGILAKNIITLSLQETLGLKYNCKWKRRAEVMFQWCNAITKWCLILDRIGKLSYMILRPLFQIGRVPVSSRQALYTGMISRK